MRHLSQVFVNIYSSVKDSTLVSTEWMSVHYQSFTNTKSLFTSPHYVHALIKIQCLWLVAEAKQTNHMAVCEQQFIQFRPAQSYIFEKASDRRDIIFRLYSKRWGSQVNNTIPDQLFTVPAAFYSYIDKNVPTSSNYQVHFPGKTHLLQFELQLIYQT